MSDFVKNIWAFSTTPLSFGIWAFPIIIVMMIITLYIDHKKKSSV